MKYYIIAGEASGDLHASNLIKELKKISPESEFRGWGGDLMQAAGATIVKHIRELAFMGFAEVLLNLRTIFRNLDLCKKDITEWKPDVVILVDYPGFNLRIAKFLKQNGIKVFYYISPQIWAWKESRVHTIKKVVDKMFVILPFEKDFYARFQMEVDYVGHPLLDAIEEFKHAPKTERENSAKPVIALLPGSRKQEISTMLPLMIETAQHFPSYDFVIAGAPAMPPEFYASFSAGKIPVVYGKTYSILQNAHAALVTSGTATLETALLGVPEVVCYKGNAISFAIAKQIVKVKYISLVNLIMDKEVVKELIQQELTVSQMKTELSKLLEPGQRSLILREYDLLREKLGGRGASARTAQLMIKYIG